MKNVKENQLKKCIYMEFEEFKDLVFRVTDGLIGAEYEFGLFYTYSNKAEEMGIYWNEDIEITLSKYFDVIITSIHADDSEEYTGVWIVYE